MADSDDLDPINEAFIQDFKDAGAHAAAVNRLESKLEGYKMRFNKYDKDQSGDLDVKELSSMMVELRKNKTEAELIELMSQVDDDNSGTIRYSEFVNLMLLEDSIIEKPMQDCVARLDVHHTKDARKRRRGALRKQKRGHLKIETSVEQKGKTYTLSVNILEAKGLQAHDWNGLSDPYVKLYLKPFDNKDKKAAKRKTKIVKKSLAPVYNEKFEYDSLSRSDIEEKVLHISMWDWDRIGANDFMGSMAFRLEDIMDKSSSSVKTSGWFILLDQEVGSSHAFPSREEDVSENPDVGQQANNDYLHVVSGGDESKSIEEFAVNALIGSGSYGDVYLGVEKATDKQFAIKILSKSRLAESNNIASCIAERNILAMKTRSPFVLSMEYAFQTMSHLFFVMEPGLGGDLMFHVLKVGSFPENHVRFYASEVVLGLEFLHKNQIIYRDLKLDNVLLNSKGHIMLADFGLAKTGIAPGGTTSTFCGTPDYMAPEILMYEPYGYPVDWWSLGIMMYEMLTGEAPFDGETEQELFSNITDDSVRIRFPRWCKADTTELLRGLLDRNQDHRFQVSKIKESKYFKNHLNWDAVNEGQSKPPIIPTKTPLDNFDEEFTSQKGMRLADTGDLSHLNQDSFKGFDFVRED
eukprot:m.185579 g.185579  ORF g.185579 m.185579 type:complete len:636 (+) comp15577_c0_seq2:114-2021(+)